MSFSVVTPFSEVWRSIIWKILNCPFTFLGHCITVFQHQYWCYLSFHSRLYIAIQKRLLKMKLKLNFVELFSNSSSCQYHCYFTKTDFHWPVWATFRGEVKCWHNCFRLLIYWLFLNSSWTWQFDKYYNFCKACRQKFRISDWLCTRDCLKNCVICVLLLIK